jgi:hypothetical protein
MEREEFTPSWLWSSYLSSAGTCGALRQLGIRASVLADRWSEILMRHQAQGWGAKVIEWLSAA